MTGFLKNKKRTRKSTHALAMATVPDGGTDQSLLPPEGGGEQAGEEQAAITPPVLTGSVATQGDEVGVDQLFDTITRTRQQASQRLHKMLEDNEKEREDNEMQRDAILERLGELGEGIDIRRNGRKGGRPKGSKNKVKATTVPAMKGFRAGRKGKMNKSAAVASIFFKDFRRGGSAREITEAVQNVHGDKITPTDVVNSLQAMRRAKKVRKTGKPKHYTYFPV